MSSSSKTGQIDFKDIFSILRRRKWIIILPALIVTAISLGGTYYLTPLYKSSTVISIDRPSNVSRELASIIGERRESRDEQRSRREALKTVLTSQRYMSELIKEMNLGDNEAIIREATKRTHSRPASRTAGD